MRLFLWFSPSARGYPFLIGADLLAAAKALKLEQDMFKPKDAATMGTPTEFGNALGRSIGQEIRAALRPEDPKGGNHRGDSVALSSDIGALRPTAA